MSHAVMEKARRFDGRSTSSIYTPLLLPSMLEHASRILHIGLEDRNYREHKTSWTTEVTTNNSFQNQIYSVLFVRSTYDP